MTAPPGPGARAGTWVRRREDRRLLLGRGRFVEDLLPRGVLHLALVRSPHAHARVTAIDGATARALPGVVAVITARDAPELRASVPPLVPSPAIRAYAHPVLAADRVRHVGEAVAAVVAESAYLAADGAELVQVEYEVLDAATTPEAALVPGAPRVQEDWPDNLAARSGGAVGDVDGALVGADTVVEGVFTYPRMAGVPLEPRGVLASVEADTGALTVWTSTQVPYQVRSAIAAALGLAEDRVRVIAPDVGGGFGVKGHVYPEDVLVPAVARRLGRPVRWCETRVEHFLAAAGDRDQVHTARLGLSRDGGIVALETRFTRDHGAFPTLGDAIALNTVNHLPGPYRVPHYRGRADNVLTHKTFIAAYRGAGRPEAAFVLDRLLDRGARAVGLDPAELRRRNLVRAAEMPYRSGLIYRDGVPITYDPADYVAGFDRLLALIDYSGWRARQSAAAAAGPRLGIGLSAYVEGTGLGPFEGADIRVDPDGTVFVRVGISSQGQAHETTLAQLCAERLGVELEQVVIQAGDTDLLPFGMGTIASRVAAVAGPAVARSADEVAERARLVAAERLECAPADIVLAGGRAAVRGAPHRALALGDVARAAVRSRALAATGRPGLSACGYFYPGSVTWAFGAHGAVVEVDPETCEVRLRAYAAVHDCGRPINPVIVEGQVHGGIAQGVGAALQEELIYDAGGQLLTGSLMDYGLPRADQLPPLAVAHLDAPSIVNPLGIKGVGESGVIAPGAAIANAVEDALAHLGVAIDRIPLTGARLFEQLAAARARERDGRRRRAGRPRSVA